MLSSRPGQGQVFVDGKLGAEGQGVGPGWDVDGVAPMRHQQSPRARSSGRPQVPSFVSPVLVTVKIPGPALSTMNVNGLPKSSVSPQQAAYRRTGGRPFMLTAVMTPKLVA